jgi:hypothetical protein
MPYPSADDFRGLLSVSPFIDLVEEFVFDGTPYDGIPFVFKDDVDALHTLRSHLSENLELAGHRPAANDIIVVGSAKIGFSLGPDTFARSFSDSSDIDVVVIDHMLYDAVWSTVLRWHYPRRRRGLAGVDQSWADHRKTEFYWGWLQPHRLTFDGLSLPDTLTPLRDLRTRWFDAFQTLSRYPAFARRDISGRLYRTRLHATLYHADGLRIIADSLRSSGQ